MKRLEWIFSGLAAVMMAAASLQATAATQTGGKDFNHMSTGFALTGVHATTACETCHVGGVFAGTPRNCDGCHAVGKRIIATPKSTKHIVTDAPCETCHFNTSTFFGARYNHGTAVPGQCENCHNGRIMAGKSSGHPVTTYTCDNCHRSSSWMPASWNHRDTASDCVACHNGTGGAGRNYASTARHNVYSSLTILTPCVGCHTNYYTFYSYRYRHDGLGAAAACGNCHANAAYAGGVTQAASAIHASATIVGISGCKSCHASYTTFLGARYNHADTYDSAYSNKMGLGSCAGCHDGTHTGIRGIPTNHTYALANLIVPATGCDACHSTPSNWRGMNHGVVLNINSSGSMPTGTKCNACHETGTSNFAGMTQKSNGHKGYNNATQDCISCHLNTYSYWNEP